MAFPYHVGHSIFSFPPRPICAWWRHRCFLRCFSSFSRGMTSLSVLLDFPCFLAYLFSRECLRCNLATATQYCGNPAIATAHDRTLSTIGFRLRTPPLGPTLAVPCRLSSPFGGSPWPLPPCLVVPASKSSLFLGSVLALSPTDPFPWITFSYLFFSAPLSLLRSNDTDPRPGFAANKYYFSRPLFLVSFRHTCP